MVTSMPIQLNLKYTLIFEFLCIFKPFYMNFFAHTIKNYSCVLTVSGIVCYEIELDSENVDVYEVCIRILAPQLFTQCMKLQVEKSRSLIVRTDTSNLIQLRCTSSEFHDILR